MTRLKLFQFLFAFSLGGLQILVFALFAYLLKDPQKKEKPIEVEFRTTVYQEKVTEEKVEEIELKEVSDPSDMSPSLNFISNNHSIPGELSRLGLMVAGGSGSGGGIGAGGGIMGVDEVDSPPKVLKEGRLEFPLRAEREGVEGVVEIMIVIGTTGMVESAKVVSSSITGYGFEEAALKSAKEMKFSAAKNQGVPVRVKRSKTYRFRVE